MKRQSLLAAYGSMHALLTAELFGRACKLCMLAVLSQHETEACRVAVVTVTTRWCVVLQLTVLVSCRAACLFASPQVAIRVLAQGLRPLIPPYEELPPNTSRICEQHPNCACLCVPLPPHKPSVCPQACAFRLRLSTPACADIRQPWSH